MPQASLGGEPQRERTGDDHVTGTHRVNAEQGTRRMTPRHWLAIGLALVLVVGVVSAQLFVRPVAPSAAAGALYLVDGTTLLPLHGDVQVQVVGATSFEPVAGQRSLQVGDRVRTGPGS